MRNFRQIALGLIAATSIPLLLACSNSGHAADEANLMQPKELAARLAKPGAENLSLFYVGFPFLYRGKHIPNSVFAGPGAKPEGLEALKLAVAKLPHDHAIVLYCGCCPWSACPNMKQPMAMLHQMGYANVKALMIPTNFAKDWAELGYPVELGTNKQ